MPRVTYDYVSKGSPVLMRERVDGCCVAEYIAFIDRGGNNWTLYPRRRYFYLRDVEFTKKKVSVRKVRIIDPPAEKAKEKKQETKQKTRVPDEPEQIKLI